MVNLPPLAELLENKFVLILGAGASKDFGFPEWHDLYALLKENLHRSCSQQSGYWLKVLSDNNERLLDRSSSGLTIDQVVAANYGNNVYRRFINNRMQDILKRQEQADKEQFSDAAIDWVSILRNKFIALLEDAKSTSDQHVISLLENFKVVSLNYDRSFAVRFYPKIIESFSHTFLESADFLLEHRTILQNFFTVFQPHGSIGALPIGSEYTEDGNPITQILSANGTRRTGFSANGIGIPYGNVSTSQYTEIDLVDSPESMNENYQHIGEFMCSSTSALVIGLSTKGIKGCRINWLNLDRVYYSSSEDPQLDRQVDCLNMHALSIAEHL